MRPPGLWLHIAMPQARPIVPVRFVPTLKLLATTAPAASTRLPISVVACRNKGERGLRRVSEQFQQMETLAGPFLERLLFPLENHLVEGVGQRLATRVGTGFVGTRFDSGLREF